MTRLFGAAALLALLSGCANIATMQSTAQRLGKGEVPTPVGTPVHDNRTPMEASLACLGDELVSRSGPRPVIAVGDIKDYTGKYAITEGNTITQGGALMVYSALGKIGEGLSVAERFDPVIAERELAYTDKRELGDGAIHEANGNKVPWIPYFGGSITKSDFYIVGGITEVNYDVHSGGLNASVNGIGPKVRTFTENVAVDLRIVDSRSLVVIKTISLAKQFSGYEIGANVFRFFGTDLFDINVGSKAQEPLQLGIRAALEEATLRLVAAVTRVDPSACMALRSGTIPEKSADQLHRERVPAAPPAAAANPQPATGGSLNDIAATGAAPSGRIIEIAFEFGDVSLSGSAQSVLDQIAQMAARGPVDVVIAARETETWDPAKRDDLLGQRLSAITAALANRGIAPGAIAITWRPDKADTSIHRDGPGLQEIAHIQVRK